MAVAKIGHAPGLWGLMAGEEILNRHLEGLRQRPRVEGGVETQITVDAVGEIEGGLARANGLGDAAEKLGRQPVEGDACGEGGREGAPLLTVVVFVRVEVDADVSADPPAQAL